MAIPTPVAAHFILIELQSFGGLQVLFDMPVGATGLHHGGQGGVGRGPDQEIGQLVWVVEAAAHQEPMATVHGASVHDWQASPVKEALPFGTQALTQTLPITDTERLLCDAGHRASQDACPCLYTDDFG